jgi:hypothetical protein
MVCLEREQVMAEQRKMFTQSMRRKSTPNTTHSHSNHGGPRSQMAVEAAKKADKDFKYNICKAKEDPGHR